MPPSFGEPITLGKQKLKNRLCKGALSEGLADPLDNLPCPRHFRLYSQWAKGGAGMIITGNVMVSRTFLENPRAVVLDKDTPLEPFKEWAEQGRQNGAKLVMQISHPGRQCPVSVTFQPVAPSPTRLRPPAWSPPLFCKARALTGREVEDLVDAFAETAGRAQEAGFDGVEIHAAHGYLISQFLSPLTNFREDKWGGTLEGRQRFLWEIVRKIRLVTGKDFIVGVKLNSTDFQKGGFEESDSIRVAANLQKQRGEAGGGVDFLEVSGGNYERAEKLLQQTRPELMKGSGGREREAYFLSFAELVHEAVPDLPLMLTGGFRSVGAIQAALDRGVVDLIGLGRPLCLLPDFPDRLLGGSEETVALPYFDWGFSWLNVVVAPMLSNTWFQCQLHKLAEGSEADPKMGVLRAVLLPFRLYLCDPLRVPIVRRLILLAFRLFDMIAQLLRREKASHQ
uniref:NADH:flavin oxidoreductase/NADH oxidase N-terminal domain-containing protein n=1 Tax=Chromera velia CCMP2878 TaxID=1169474 RepID=A0A0G4IA01_9ALVE|eukprot:Cvel_2083.t1-p1 / transcript=Cvel_2083.t1 / gene=Cvel_2083 / organism=Chromera_velia_CCMP2878 / gene_product=NADH oxidase, putative / transcript_product=NADH oxidase, putative / location=Cvel_scaffold80:103787-105686(+) / protein_length=451 / sequence_SO=supercontig / SO=protein_coding / is_pseudo=false